MGWYTSVVKGSATIEEFIAYHEKVLPTYQREVIIGKSITREESRLPGITEQVFRELQEVEAVLNYLNIQFKVLEKQYYHKYLEQYNKALSLKEAEKYINGEDEIVAFSVTINDVALVRNLYLAVMKGLDQKSYMLGHISRLKGAGLDDDQIL